MLVNTEGRERSDNLWHVNDQENENMFSKHASD